MADSTVPADIEAKRLKELQDGPLSILYNASKSKTTVMINCRNNKKLLAKVKAFDRHCNMILENVHELWTETPKTGRGVAKATPVVKERTISKMFLRGDSVITVIYAPK